MDSVFLSSTQYLFLRASKGDDTIASEGYISFFTPQGFFAALGHNESNPSIPYADAEVCAIGSTSDELIQIGRILVSQPTGIYGAFYDDYEPPILNIMPIVALSDIEASAPAELWMTDVSGTLRVYSGVIVVLFPDKQYPVLFEVTDDQFPGASFGSSGSVVVQAGRIAAVVAGANTYPARLLYCTSAEQMMMDLKAMIQELVGLEKDS